MSSFKIPTRRVTLDGRELELSSVGLGLMSLSVFLGAESDPGHCSEENCMEVIGKALEHGVNLVNSASFYGSGHNERMLGKAIAKFGRDKFFITDKFGQIRDPATGKPLRYDCSEKGVFEQCEASLARLGTDYIDVYIPARVDPNTPIEDTVAALSKLQKAGKIRHIGLSEANAVTVRRAAKVAPISFLEIEYSLWSAEIESVVLPTCRELGIRILAYSPLGRGFLTGTVKAEDLKHDWRGHAFPRFHPDNAAHNKTSFVDPIEEIASRLTAETGSEVKPGQVALAWVLSRGDDIFPIPGTKRPHLVEENLRAATLKLSDDDLAKLNQLATETKAAGTRYNADGMKMLQDLSAEEKL